MIKIGSVLLGKYLITGLISSGGTSVIYKAHHNGLNIDVALKKINKNLIDTNYRHEIDILKNLSHKMLPRVYDLIKYGQESFIVIEYIEGLSLQDKVNRFGVLTEMDVTKIAIKLLSVLNYIHNNGVVHSDIKPANIMINTAGDLKLVDFGISATNNSKALGKTKGFSAPEQSYNNNINIRTDIYAFGATMYYLLTAEIYQHNNNKQLPKAIAKILKKCLHINPNKRYNNVTQILRDIKRIIKPNLLNKRKVILILCTVFTLLLITNMYIKKHNINKLYLQYIENGSRYIYASQYPLAKECFIKAINYNQSKSKAFLSLAQLYVKQKEYELCTSLAIDTKKLKKDRDYGELLENIADSYLYLNNKEDAYKYYSEAKKYSKENPDLLQKFAELAYELNKTSEAIAALKKALKKENNNAISNMLMGEIEYLHHNYDQSKRYLSKSLNELDDSEKKYKCYLLLADIYKQNQENIDQEIEALKCAKQYAKPNDIQLVNERLAEVFYRKALGFTHI